MRAYDLPVVIASMLMESFRFIGNPSRNSL